MTATTEDQVTTFDRRGESATSGLRPFASAICDNPGDSGPWLVLADWLEEGGHAGSASLIRSLWADDAPPADGRISRGYYEWENGGKHWVGVTVEFKEGSWHLCYWANGNWTQAITRTEARQNIALKGKPYRIEKREKWTGEVSIIEGITPYSGLSIYAD